jgi:fatty acid desaturase
LDKSSPRTSPVEWPTLGLLIACYALWGGALFYVAEYATISAIILIAVSGALHASLQHEVIHGHPTPWWWVNAGLVAPALTLYVPYLRFRDTHLAHHTDAILTDPYDDPESNYLDPKVWSRMHPVIRFLLARNNCLLGRIVIGPLIGQWCFVRSELQLIIARSPGVLAAWLLHLPLAAGVIWVATQSPLPVWAFLLGTYGAISILKIRTFLEHQAHEKCRARTVIIEDRGVLALLFLNNNFHVVHHMHPRVPWYRLPGVYTANRARYLETNDGYRYRSYWDVIARYFFRAKDPVAHPLMPTND